MLININGKLVTQEKACISVFDHGLLYGDGVFETLRTYNGRIFMLQKHLNRLYLSARQLKLAIPISKRQMKQEIEKTVAKNRLQEAYIRLTVTRGVGEIGLIKECKPTFFIIAKEFIPYKQKLYDGVKLIISEHYRTLPKIKSINFLANILAAQEAREKDAFDALFSHGDEPTECTTSNFYIIKNNSLITSPNVLDGITRSIVLALAKKRLGIARVKIQRITKEQVFAADECFLTNTTMEIVPVIMVDGKKIGNCKIGRITQQLHADFTRFVRDYHERG